MVWYVSSFFLLTSATRSPFPDPFLRSPFPLPLSRLPCSALLLRSPFLLPCFVFLLQCPAMLPLSTHLLCSPAPFPFPLSFSAPFLRSSNLLPYLTPFFPFPSPLLFPAFLSASILRSPLFVPVSALSHFPFSVSLLRFLSPVPSPFPFSASFLRNSSLYFDVICSLSEPTRTAKRIRNFVNAMVQFTTFPQFQVCLLKPSNPTTRAQPV